MSETDQICSNSDLPRLNLGPEPQEGNVEYKLKLVNLTDVRLEHLTTQMLWRLEEGGGEAVYQIGVEDCGNMKGLSLPELDYSLRTVTQMAERLNAKIVSLTRTRTPSGRWAARVVVRRLPQGVTRAEVRLAMLGAVDAGKSSLLGVLSSGVLDNGCGLSRLNLFRHPHEVSSGRTSSMSFEVLGFDNHGRVLNYGQVPNPDMFLHESHSVVTMVDLAGCTKYFKTTVNGLLGFRPHYAALTISAVSGPVAASFDHLSIARALDISVFAVITKKDLLSPDLYPGGIEKYLTDKILEPLAQSCTAIGADLDIVFVRSAEDAAKMAKELSFGNKTVLPVFCVSSVTGEGVGMLTQFFHSLEPRRQTVNVLDPLAENDSVFYVREVFNIQSVGTVVGGALTSGLLTVEQVVRIGPDADGHFSLAKVRSLHWSRNPVEIVRPGQYAAICLDFEEPTKALHLKRGSVLLSLSVEPVAIRRFTAIIRPFSPFGLHQQTSSVETLATMTAPVAVQLHRGGFCQTVAALHFEKIEPENNDQVMALDGTDSDDAAPWLSDTRYTCTIDFVDRSGFIKVGDRFFLRRHAFRALGHVTELHDVLKDTEPITLIPDDPEMMFGTSPPTEAPPSFQ